jgi:hypothetical protein
MSDIKKMTDVKDEINSALKILGQLDLGSTYKPLFYLERTIDQDILIYGIPYRSEDNFEPINNKLEMWRGNKTNPNRVKSFSDNKYFDCRLKFDLENKRWYGKTDILQHRLTLHPKKHDKIIVKTIVDVHPKRELAEQFRLLKIKVVYENRIIKHYIMYGIRNKDTVSYKINLPEEMKSQFETNLFLGHIGNLLTGRG